jgi:hypothetical protein
VTMDHRGSPDLATGSDSVRPVRALGWLAGGAVLTFVVSLVGTDLLGLHHDLYYLLYFTIVLAYLAAFVARTGVPWQRVFGRNLAWSIGIGAVVAAAVARQILTQPGTARPSGAYLAFEVAWRGVVYGVVDALVLFVLPALVAVLLLGGDRRGFARKVAFAGVTLVCSLVVVTTYHLGYAEFRGGELLQPQIGAVLFNVPAMLTGNPVGAVVAHATAHVTAVLHQYYGGGHGFLPPELTPGYPGNARGLTGTAVAAGWLILTTVLVLVVLGRDRIFRR